mgnify:CR=1 FL=1
MTLRVLETVYTLTTLGVRFYDPAKVAESGGAS